MNQLSQNYFRWLFPAFLVALVFSKAMASVLEVSLLVLSIGFAWRKVSGASLKEYFPMLSIGLLFVAYLVGITCSEDKATGWRMAGLQHSLLVIPIIFYLNREEAARGLERYMKFFIWAAAVAGIFTLLLNAPGPHFVKELTHKYTFLEPYETPANTMAQFGLYNPFHPKIQFSNLLGVAALCCFYLLALNPKQWLLHIALGAIMVSSLALGGRGGQLALLLGVCLFFAAALWQWWIPKVSAKLGRPLAIATFMAAVFSFTLLTPMALYKYFPPVTQRYNQLFWEMEMLDSGQYVQHEYQYFTSLRRIVSWQNSWELVKEYPVTGTGTGDYKAELGKIYAQSKFAELPVNIHSQYLYVWGCLGIWGLDIFLLSLLWWLWTVWRKGRGWLMVFGLAFMGFYLVSMIPDAVLLRQSDNMIFALFFAWLSTAVISRKEVTA